MREELLAGVVREKEAAIVRREMMDILVCLWRGLSQAKSYREKCSIDWGLIQHVAEDGWWV